MPCISSSSDEEELTCLLDVVGGGVPNPSINNQKQVIKEDIKDADTFKVREKVQQLQISDQVKTENTCDDTNTDTTRSNECLSDVCLTDQVEILKKEICDILIKRERASALMPDSNTNGGREEELRAELARSREKFENAKSAKEQLRALYKERNESRDKKGMVKASQEEFKRMKEEYFRAVVKAGKLEERQRELKHEVRESNKNVAKLQKELQWTTGVQENHNPWMVGVPYGSKATKSMGMERDRFGRFSEERGPCKRF